MKALLVVGFPNPARSNLEWTGIVLLPTDDPEDDPLLVVSLNDNNEIRFGYLSSEDLKKLRIAKEVTLSQRVVNIFNDALRARLEFVSKEAKLKEALLEEKVHWACDALSFLDYGGSLL